MMPFVSWSGAPTNSPICPTFHLSSDHNSFPVCHDVPSVHTVPQKRLYIIRQIILLFCVTNWISHEFTSPSISSSSSFHQQISAEREGGASHMRIVESIISTPVLSTKHLDLQDCCTMKRKLHFLAPVVLILYPSATVSAFRPKFGRNTSFSWANRSVKLFGKPKDDLPANLKRKVDAKRPQLGHIVPNDTRAKGAGGTANPKLRPQGKARAAGLNNPSMLKIAGGTARGKRLDSPDVYLRPMMGKVREAIYSTLTSFGVYDEKYPVRHLDLFAGSGSVGLESLSRGAGHCTFCDLSPNCCAAVERNIDWCQFNTEEYTTQVVCADVLQLLRNPDGVGIPQGETFGIITMGPPYEEVVYADLLSAVSNSPVVREDTLVVIEYPVELWGDIPHVYQGEADTGVTMVGIRNRKYGRTVIAMYICNPTGRIENADSRPEEFI